MQQTQDQHNVPLDAIRKNIWRAPDNQLTCAPDTANATDTGIIGQMADGVLDCIAEVDRGPGIALCNIGKLVFTILPSDR